MAHGTWIRRGGRALLAGGKALAVVLASLYLANSIYCRGMRACARLSLNLSWKIAEEHFGTFPYSDYQKDYSLWNFDENTGVWLFRQEPFFSIGRMNYAFVKRGGKFATLSLQSTMEPGGPKAVNLLAMRKAPFMFRMVYETSPSDDLVPRDVLVVTDQFRIRDEDGDGSLELNRPNTDEEREEILAVVRKEEEEMEQDVPRTRRLLEEDR